MKKMNPIQLSQILLEADKDKKIDPSIMRSLANILKSRSAQYLKGQNIKSQPKVTIDGMKVTIDLGAVSKDVVGNKTASPKELESKIAPQAGVKLVKVLGTGPMSNAMTVYTDDLDKLEAYLLKNGFRHKRTANGAAIVMPKKRL